MNNQQVPVDQSQFASEQERAQAPPEELARRAYMSANQEAIKKKRRGMILGFLGLVVVMTLVIVLFTLRPAPPTPVLPTPTPTLPPQGPSLLEQEMTRLEQVVDEADPQTEPYVPPPVDMEVEF